MVLVIFLEGKGKCALTPGGRYFVVFWTLRVRATAFNHA